MNNLHWKKIFVSKFKSWFEFIIKTFYLCGWIAFLKQLIKWQMHSFFKLHHDKTNRTITKRSISSDCLLISWALIGGEPSICTSLWCKNRIPKRWSGRRGIHWSNVWIRSKDKGETCMQTQQSGLWSEAIGKMLDGMRS